MICLDNKTLRKVQLTQLEMLVEVDRICKKCDIHYNVIAGTLLGAIRHGGYIPWDDDADVAFLRNEYIRFREVCKTELDTSRFEFQDHETTEGYRWGYGKLRRKDTLFLREHQEKMPYFQGIFIDLFPLDGVPDNYILRCIHNFRCFCIRKVLWSEIGKNADKSKLKRSVYSILSGIPLKRVFKSYNELTKKNMNSQWVRILTFPTPNNEFGYKRKWYENSSDIVFEGKTFKSIKDYDEYLSFKFGEYMKLPPESKRKTHPVSVIRV